MLCRNKPHVCSEIHGFRGEEAKHKQISRQHFAKATAITSAGQPLGKNGTRPHNKATSA
jgi:hypothetical protein